MPSEVTILRFGRYRGRDLRDVPESYLDTLAALELAPDVREAVHQEITRRRENRAQNDLGARDVPLFEMQKRPPETCSWCLASPCWPRCRGACCSGPAR